MLIFVDGRAELTVPRPDTVEARGSDFFVFPITDPARLRATLPMRADAAQGSQRRHVFLYRRTRSPR